MENQSSGGSWLGLAEGNTIYNYNLYTNATFSLLSCLGKNIMK